MMSRSEELSQKAQARVRLSRKDRYQQLIDAAWRLAREEGTDALTLPKLSEKAGITKPVIYQHFRTRDGLLTALYKDYDDRQTARLDEALQRCTATLESRARVISDNYIDCVLSQGREIPDLLAALAGSPDLYRTKRQYQFDFIERCSIVLGPFASPEESIIARYWAILGAAESLSQAAAVKEIGIHEAKAELYNLILAVVNWRPQA